MFPNHEDNPNELHNYIASLTPSERIIFDKGYIAALLSVIEQINDSQRKLLAKMLIHLDDEEALEQLKSRMLLLDIYEKHYRNRIKNLSIRYLQT